MEDCVVVQNLKEDNSETEFNSSFIEKEIDMGFFENFIFDGNEKKYFQNGCQRIHHCSCDCNRCAGIIG
jgi:hypothetical protein